MFFSCAAASAWAIGNSSSTASSAGNLLCRSSKVGEVLPLEQLHRDEWIPEFGLAEVVDTHDRGVTEPRGRPGLVEQPLSLRPRLLVGIVEIDELDGDIDVEHHVVGDPHGAAAPLTVEADQLVLVDAEPRRVTGPGHGLRRLADAGMGRGALATFWNGRHARLGGAEHFARVRPAPQLSKIYCSLVQLANYTKSAISPPAALSPPP